MASQLIVAEKEYPFDIVILRHHVYKSVAFPFFDGLFPKKSSLHCLCYTNHTTVGPVFFTDNKFREFHGIWCDSRKLFSSNER